MVHKHIMARALKLNKAVKHLQNIEDQTRKVCQGFFAELLSLCSQYPEIVEELNEDELESDDT